LKKILITTALLMSSNVYADNTIYACIGNFTKVVRDVGTGGKCLNNETPIQWNITGPQGIQGPIGLTGPQGATGPAGSSSILTPSVCTYSDLLGKWEMPGIFHPIMVVNSDPNLVPNNFVDLKFRMVPRVTVPNPNTNPNLYTFDSRINVPHVGYFDNVTYSSFDYSKLIVNTDCTLHLEIPSGYVSPSDGTFIGARTITLYYEGVISSDKNNITLSLIGSSGDNTLTGTDSVLGSREFTKVIPFVDGTFVKTQ
jgi:hypothetical protein